MSCSIIHRMLDAIDLCAIKVPIYLLVKSSNPWHVKSRLKVSWGRPYFLKSFLLLLVAPEWCILLVQLVQLLEEHNDARMNLWTYETLFMKLFNSLEVVGGSMLWIVLALARSRPISFPWTTNHKNFSVDTQISKIHSDILSHVSYKDFLQIIYMIIDFVETYNNIINIIL